VAYNFLFLRDAKAAHSASVQLANHMHRLKTDGPFSPTSGDVKEALIRWAKATTSAIGGAERHPQRMHVQPIAINLVYEGCRVVFSPTDDSELESSDLMLTEAGVQYLEGVVTALAKITKHWEENYIFEDEEFSRLPGALIWAKAMLHWFQWLTWPSGRLPTNLVDDPRLKGGVRGWSRGPRLAPGLRCVCSCLLMAQAVSTGDPRFQEPLTGLLPATVGLARLLLGRGQSTSWSRFYGHLSTSLADFGGTRVFVPKEAPQARPVASSQNRTSLCVDVCSVQLGSAAAAAIASAHLKGVIGRIKVAGVVIDPDNVRDKVDVGSSESLWTAVMLYKAATAKAKTLLDRGEYNVSSNILAEETPHRR
jgi:hypothetical protein